MQIKCLSCDKQTSKAHRYCPYCNARLVNICVECDKTLQDGWENCPYCGAREMLLPDALKEGIVNLNILSTGFYLGKENLILELSKNRFDKLYICIPPFSIFKSTNNSIQSMISMEGVLIKLDKKMKNCGITAFCLDYHKEVPKKDFKGFLFDDHHDAKLINLLMSLLNMLKITGDFESEENILKYFILQLAIWVYRDNITYDKMLVHPIVEGLTKKYDFNIILDKLVIINDFLVKCFQQNGFDLNKFAYFTYGEEFLKEVPIFSVLDIDVNSLPSDRMKGIFLELVNLLELNNIVFSIENKKEVIYFLACNKEEVLAKLREAGLL